jgi:hypothetical protein
MHQSHWKVDKDVLFHFDNESVIAIAAINDFEFNLIEHRSA